MTGISVIAAQEAVNETQTALRVVYILAGVSGSCKFADGAYIVARYGTDPSGALVAGAEVNLENPAIGFHASHPTGANGAYEFSRKVREKWGTPFVFPAIAPTKLGILSAEMWATRPPSPHNEDSNAGPRFFLCQHVRATCAIPAAGDVGHPP